MTARPLPLPFTPSRANASLQACQASLQLFANFTEEVIANTPILACQPYPNSGHLRVSGRDTTSLASAFRHGRWHARNSSRRTRRFPYGRFKHRVIHRRVRFFAVGRLKKSNGTKSHPRQHCQTCSTILSKLFIALRLISFLSKDGT